MSCQWGQNLSYPLLQVSPAFGDGMRRYVDGVKSEAYAEYLEDPKRTVRIRVKWGNFTSSKLPPSTAHLSVHGLGRRPAYRLLEEESLRLSENGTGGTLEVPLETLRVDKGEEYPEYLAQLRVVMDDGTGTILLQRALHILPPIETLQYRLQDVLWAPGIPGLDEGATRKNERNEAVGSNQEQPASRRRGFGLEIETVQLPPDAEFGDFTAQDEFERALQGNDAANNGGDGRDSLLWRVSRDPQVENAAPAARLHLYKQLQRLLVIHETKHRCSSRKSPRELVGFSRALQLIEPLFVTGPDEIDLDLDRLTLFPNAKNRIHCNLSSPEYTSPPPPHELYYSFPPDNRADMEIQNIFDALKSSRRPILCPTISLIGQSASSIHVHVNVRNPLAWPRRESGSTEFVLSVLVQWIRFDSVIRMFAKPWMWRDRSFVPMFATGPEFVFAETAWNQGATVTDNAMYNVPAFFRHAFQGYRKGWDFDRIFDPEVIRSTLSRWCSLNLLSLEKYGTVEVRRMHATLDAEFVCAWTKFCVAFVEHFGSDFETYGKSFFADVDDSESGLERLVESQNHATLEELVEIMTSGDSPLLTRETFSVLMPATAQ